MSKRSYDLVLLGATGYTGKLVAEYITKTFPTNIKWAVAGRSQSKLESVVSSIKSLNSDRTQPDVLTVDLNKADLDKLVKKTRILLNCVGPYHLYSTPVVEACASASTHYLDVTGETPWLHDIITKYNKTAKSKSTILIPSIGVESAPSDLLAYLGVGLIRRVWDCGVMDMVCSVHELKTTGPSGGTLATGLGLAGAFPTSTLREMASNPYWLAPPTPDHMSFKRTQASADYPVPTTYERTAFQKLTGPWVYEPLGILTTSLTSTPNVAVVHRSAGLTPLFYGFNFTYEEYMAVRSTFVGVLVHSALVLVTLALAFPPTRFLFSWLFTKYAPGSGPNTTDSSSDILEMRAVAVAEQLAKKPRKALSTFRFEGGMYHLTAVLMAEGAMVLLEDGGVEEVLQKHGAGFLTPSCLGDRYVERLKKVAGLTLDVKQMGAIGSK